VRTEPREPECRGRQAQDLESAVNPGRFGVVIKNLAIATEKTRTLKPMGLRIIIDDFGVGYF
jgi:predicted signal transduction protein with EAL and GGDEF domain